MSDKQFESESLPGGLVATDLEARERREFLLSLGKWSKAVIGGVLLGGVLVPGQEARAQGGAGLWYNSGRGWGGWVQQPWGWYDGPRWYDGPYRRRRPYWRGHGWYNGPRHGHPWHNGWYNR
jgi:hypothetical protein